MESLMEHREFRSGDNIREPWKAKASVTCWSIEQRRRKALMQPKNLTKVGGKDSVYLVQGRERPWGENRCVPCFGKNPSNGNLNL